MTKLLISPDLSLAPDVITEALAILAARGAGKSNAAVVLAEEMYDNGLPWVAIDPKGDWHGIRSAGDGHAPGLSVVVFGGLHGDVPLEPTAGRLVADLIVDERMTCVLDVSEMTKADQRRFLLDFAERLYRRNTEPLHVFCEEADEYIPQMVRGEAAKLVGAFETLVKRGRFRGLGVTLITQRSASLNKDVLTQVETLIAMRTPSPQDRKAILAWVDVHDAGRELVDQLPTLDSGEAWVFSPHALKVVKRIRFRRRRTFDSGATPKVGGKPRPPARLADVDLAAIKEAMAETIERAKADDPLELRKRIAELERQLRDQPAPQPVRVEVPVLSDTDRAIVDTFRATVDAAAEQWTEVTRSVTMLAERIGAHDGRSDLPRTRPAGDAGHQVGPGRRAAQRPDPPVRREPSRPAVQRAAPTQGVAAADAALGKTERTILAVLVQHGPRDHRQLALQSGYSAKASTIRVALGKLRRLGYVEPNAPIRATAAGVEALGDYEPLPTGRELLDYWRGQLDGTSTNVLDAMLGFYPHDTTKDEIAQATGYSPDASTIRVALGKLRRLELVDGWRISDDFARSTGLV